MSHLVMMMASQLGEDDRNLPGRSLGYIDGVHLVMCLEWKKGLHLVMNLERKMGPHLAKQIETN